MNADDETSIQLMFLHHLRESLPADKIITYTFPVDMNSINFPYRDILRYGQDYVDVFNVSTVIRDSLNNENRHGFG